MSEKTPSRAAPVGREIARRSKSNLAFALSTLPRQRKEDMMTFYAFCRVIDDIADEPVDTVEERQLALDEWKHGILHGFDAPDELQAEVAELPGRYPIDPALLAEIVNGVASDLVTTRYRTYEDLLAYCYKVACVVGLVSIEIFGYKNPVCKEYAVALGYALQLTNIIRDVAEDARNGRIYLPQEDLQRFGVTEADLLEGRHTPEFEALMQCEHDRARGFFSQAASLLPKEDRRHMLAAEMMGQMYGEILEKIRQRRFQVFGPRIGLSKLRKIAILGAYTAKGLLRTV
ncbi:farnesyl-diphosphate farnesyltransferase [Roseimicrobium gellanilyticum]|uniref:Farnesyl-diphosphate farnesyltransferase n=1 Tax=Roseimicrobium gellanilyticum TaxID=748857 RepID=A0A366HW43_9BACT|nr:squalene/phytoene synthase family protein [Roseimicrobium gellanilyticum]RBP47705.1 farnesyl-diphosphate farnesyltransferase [Roseimicrobium gellanilyticum]